MTTQPVAAANAWTGLSRNSPPGSAVGETKTPFEEFLLAEYQNLAQGHFNSINTISEFFKQYILIASLPISAAVVFLKPSELSTSGIWGYLKHHSIATLVPFLLIAAAGLCVLGYMINLRLDAILYARSINGLRKYFYETSALQIENELRFRVLPTSIDFPKYIEARYFVFVVLTFAIIGTAYFYAGLYSFYWASGWPPYHRPLLYLAALACFSLHLLLYGWLGRYREHAYLRGPLIGIDMDGVLNEHRRHFCGLLATQVGKQLDPGQISSIPVHTIPGCGVTREDEQSVFNWPQYWVELPAVTGAADTIERLTTLLGYRVWIFTSRGWPDPTGFPKGREEQYWKEWQKFSKWALPAQWKAVQYLEKQTKRLYMEPVVSAGMLRNMTKDWLKQNGFKWNELFIERGGPYTRDLLLRKWNRFILSEQGKVRVFVEDDLNNALKLGGICDIVFLFDHPYNQAAELPKNVMRVTSGQDIWNCLRRIC